MLNEVRRTIRRERMFDPGEPLYVAVSGGIDSMVLLHLLVEAGHPCTVLHVHHGLRGAESEGDRAFVEDHCRHMDIPFRCKRVDARAHARQRGISIQMAARELRYAFFQEVRRELPLKTALGHHQDDALETLLMNLLRGTGTRGWSAIPPVSGCFVRPLIGVSREAIQRYASQRSIPFRQDSANTDPKYLRSRIRHELLPLMESMRPGARQAMARSFGLLRELERAGDRVCGAVPSGPEGEGGTKIPFTAVEDSTVPMLLLHHRLRGKGFHPDAIERLYEAIVQRHTGAEFLAAGWRAVVDRDAVLVGPAQHEAGSFIIHGDEASGSAGGFQWSIHQEDRPAPPRTMDDVLLDATRLEFPLELRPWRPGDRMRPIGLQGSKLISDILIDAKVPRPMKDRTYVLVDGTGGIVWLAGHRIGEGFQATPECRRVLRIRKG